MFVCCVCCVYIVGVPLIHTYAHSCVYVGPLLTVASHTHTQHKRTAVFNASWKGHSEILSYLISNGADIEMADKVGDAPLIIGAYKGHMSCVSILVEAGANVCAQNNVRV